MRSMIRTAAGAVGLLPAAMAAVLAQSPAPPQAPARLVTRWAADVRPDRVLPEYPRPQMTRADWQNLNGSWQYAITARQSDAPAEFAGPILVPFAIESVLSGARKAVTPDQYLWYRRSFEAPRRQPGGRILLHFGAVDWEAAVSVNGKPVGEHRGGYDPFTFDITDALRPSGTQEIVVRVWDPTDKGPQPRGKQTLNPRGIWYTAVTGIWQTVWLEPVPAAYIAALRIDPDVDAGVVRVQVDAAGAAPAGATAQIEAFDGSSSIAKASGRAGESIAVRIPSPKLWSPSTPFLYDMTVRLSTGDSVKSYFGLRKIAVAKDADGVNRLFLNGAPLFQFGQLDQGWWPDGLYTAPTGEALRFDIETQKKMGFNAIRKHVKVEPARWYYECDRLGMMVWQDMPSGDNDTPDGIEGFGRELTGVIAALRNHPSIVMWVPFNEGWGQHQTEKYVAAISQQDPTRLVNNASGWNDVPVGQIVDGHAYPGPAGPPQNPTRAAVIGEFGGLGLPLEGHTWLEKGNWGYRSYTSPEALEKAYRDLLAQLRLQIANGAAAAIYTQTTDVEIEVNGLMTYDRAVMKLPVEGLASWHAPLYRTPPRMTAVVKAADLEPATWRYTSTQPPDGWMREGFDVSGWAEGKSGFGRKDTRWGPVGTEWTTSDLWLRRTFDLKSTSLANPHLKIFHDDGAEVYLNGQPVATLAGSSGGYTFVPLDGTARKLLKPGTNTLAIHVHQERGGQYIDAGIVDVTER